LRAVEKPDKNGDRKYCLERADNRFVHSGR